MLGTGWKEVFLNDSPQEEAALFALYAQEMQQAQRDIMDNTRAPAILRAMHAKGLVATKRAKFQVGNVPEHLRVGLFQPGQTYDVVVRFSNGHGSLRDDKRKDLRGAAIKVLPGDGSEHDFLMTNAPKHHARNVREIVAFTKAFNDPALLTEALEIVGVESSSNLLEMVREGIDKIAGIRRLLVALGFDFKSTKRILSTLREQTSVSVESLATETYYSRTPIAFGAIALKYRLAPEAQKSQAPEPNPDLHREFKDLLAQGDVRFNFEVQLFVDESQTPIEDPTKEWLEAIAPFEPLATLIIEQQDLESDQAKQDAAEIESLAFNPWTVSSPDFRPLGEFNRARQVIYPGSVKLRLGT